MRLSDRSLERLTQIVTGDGQLSPYRSGPKLVNFFNLLGGNDEYGQGFGSRFPYARSKLESLNGTPKMADAILAAFNFWDDDGFDCEQQGTLFNKLLTRDGYRLSKENKPGWMEGGRRVDGPPYFLIRPIGGETVEPTALSNLNHDTLQEQIGKCSEKIGNGDYSGAITNAYTLIEALLKDLLRRTNTPFKEDEGDIRNLYNLLKGPLNLDPKEESLGLHLKTILDGFQKIMSGLFTVANKGSDRHDRRYEPAAHHAKLVVNSAFALGEFLCDTFEYQRDRRAGETA